MTANLFKALYAIIGICLVVLLFGIYQKMSGSRFQVIQQSSGAMLFDTQTNEVYYIGGEKWHRVKSDGSSEVVSELPK